MAKYTFTKFYEVRDVYEFQIDDETLALWYKENDVDMEDATISSYIFAHYHDCTPVIDREAISDYTYEINDERIN